MMISGGGEHKRARDKDQNTRNRDKLYSIKVCTGIVPELEARQDSHRTSRDKSRGKAQTHE